MRAIELFKQITKIPRCSGNHQPFIDFLIDFSKQHNYICKVDNANNILCYKENQTPIICLQSHYDIVCLEDGKIPKIIEIDGYLKAKDSTLGADNGMGCAYMLALMEENTNGEFLFTCDEEIGLIGANNIEHNLKSKYMLNLDSEDEGEICIGCAGGVDIFVTNNHGEYLKNKDLKDMYEISIDNLDGGHSGVDIDKNIPNALKLLVKTIKECDGDLLDISGGERINSIPKRAKAIIVTDKEPIKSHENMIIEKIEQKTIHYKKLDENIIKFIYTFANGVRGYDKELDVVLNSINLAIIENTINGVKISLSARSMDNEELKTLKDETISLLENHGFEVTTDGKYPAWKPTQSNFTTKVLDIYKKEVDSVSLNAVHAGLECAIFKNKYPNMEICSIGPNIYFPHSTKEECEISSAIKLYNIVKNIINQVK
jgi:dipeptidase D